MTISTARLTYDDLAQFPADGRRYEIIEGELYMAPAPGWWHERFTTRLVRNFIGYLEPRGLLDGLFTAPVDVWFADGTVVEPDLVYVDPRRQEVFADRRYLTGAPDLLVEILSPSSRAYDQQVKARLYAAEGVPEYWIVDPQHRAVTVFALRDGVYVPVPGDGARARSLVLPGFTLDVPALFAGLP